MRSHFDFELRPSGFLTVAVCVLAFACSDPPSKDDTNNGGTNGLNGGTANNTVGEDDDPLEFDPGVGADESLNTLSEEELGAVCDATNAYWLESGAIAALCLIEGYNWAELSESMDDAVLRDTCQDRLETCLEEQANRGLPQVCGPSTDCTGTVEQAVACAVDVGEGDVMATAELPKCDAITFEDLGRQNEIQRPPAPNCAALNETCNN